MNLPQRQPPAPSNLGPSNPARSSDLRRIDVETLGRADADKTGRQMAMIRQFVRAEAAAIEAAADAIDQTAVAAARMTADCQGSVIVTGVGKAGLVGQKLVATLASTGTAAHFLHPCEAVHGDLGRVRRDDLVWALSNSGRSEEVTRIADQISQQATGLISFTATDDNPLAQQADVAVTFGSHREIDPNGLAPTASTSVMMAVGDAVAMLASSIRQFTPTDFARFHPGGALGRKLSQAADLMRPLSDCRIASDQHTIRQAMTTTGTNGRRSGAMMIVDQQHRLRGIFTDSDLARLFQSRQEHLLDDCVAEHMTSPCIQVSETASYETVVGHLTEKRISELPVVDSLGTLLGMVDITDLMTVPADNASTSVASDTDDKPQLSIVTADPQDPPR